MKNNDPLMSAFLIFNSEDDPIINATQKRLKAKEYYSTEKENILFYRFKSYFKFSDQLSI